jgi:hypothetical protein
MKVEAIYYSETLGYLQTTCSYNARDHIFNYDFTYDLFNNFDRSSADTASSGRTISESRFGRGVEGNGYCLVGLLEITKGLMLHYQSPGQYLNT